MDNSTPIYDQLVREREQQQCPPDTPQDDTGPDQPTTAADPGVSPSPPPS